MTFAMRHLRLILAVLLTVAVAGTARAGYEEGVVAMERMDYAVALREFRAAAETGHAGAQYYLGRMHLMAEGAPADYRLAMEYLGKAAAQGNANAQYYLGVLYYRGAGVSRDYAKAVKWYIDAAAQGDQVAQYSLGVMYAAGVGVTRDAVEALAWFNLAAAGGSAPAEMFRKLIVAGMSPDEISMAERRAQERRSTRR